MDIGSSGTRYFQILVSYLVHKKFYSLFKGIQSMVWFQNRAIRHSVDRALPALSALSDLQLSQLFQLSQFCQFFHSSDALSSPSSSNFEIENWRSWESTYEKSERTNRVGRAGKGGRGREIGDPRELRELEELEEPCPQSVFLPRIGRSQRGQVQRQERGACPRLEETLGSGRIAPRGLLRQETKR